MSSKLTSAIYSSIVSLHVSQVIRVSFYHYPVFGTQCDPVN